jgi:hypothetical protein
MVVIQEIDNRTPVRASAETAGLGPASSTWGFRRAVSIVPIIETVNPVSAIYLDN